MNKQRALTLAGAGSLAIAALALPGCGDSGFPGQRAAPVVVAEPPPTVIPTPTTPTASTKAVCGPGSRPETGMQGRVSRAEVESGRAAMGYTCNTEMVGSFITANMAGTVGGFKVERYVDKAGHDCAYYDTTLLFPTNAAGAEAGVNVLDMSDPTKPVMTARLVTPAMLSPHESLILSKERGVLAAVLGNPAFGPGVVDLYDISADCRTPVLKSSLPVGIFGHESGMSPDGNTFYSASPGTPTLSAIDISNLSVPRLLLRTPIQSHGLTISADGNRAYVAGGGGDYPGMVIVDTSQIQARAANPQMPVISNVVWPTLSIPQNAIPITIKGKPYVVEVDEYSVDDDGNIGAHQDNVGAARIIDISDEKNPRVISDMRLEVHERANRPALADDPGAQNPTQGYAGHYCNVPTRTDPTIVACSFIMSGLRIFDITDPAKPKEVAYFNAPVRARPPAGFFEASAWAMSSPAFVPERKEIWYTDGYNGFFVVRVTNDMWK